MADPITVKALSAGLIMAGSEKFVHDEPFQVSAIQGLVTGGSIMVIDFMWEFLPASLLNSLGGYAMDILSSALAAAIHYYQGGNYGIKRSPFVKSFLMNFGACLGGKYISQPVAGFLPSSSPSADMLGSDDY